MLPFTRATNLSDISSTLFVSGEQISHYANLGRAKYVNTFYRA